MQSSTVSQAGRRFTTKEKIANLKLDLEAGSQIDKLLKEIC
jgi:hypothetical protein